MDQTVLSLSQLDELAVALAAACVETGGVIIAGAESCTGGMIASAITSVSGSSGWFDCAFVTYSNAAKMALLGVPQHILDAYGAVSEQTAQAMAQGALERSGATLAYAVTGVAGPTGGSLLKPVGMVCFGFCDGANVWTATEHFQGDRAAVRMQSAAYVLQEITRIVASRGKR